MNVINDIFNYCLTELIFSYVLMVGDEAFRNQLFYKDLFAIHLMINQKTKFRNFNDIIVYFAFTVKLKSLMIN